jgi:uncharacterized membrane protein
MWISGIGHALFGASVAGLAILCLAFGNFAPAFEAFGGPLPWSEVWVRGLAAILLAASAGLFFVRSAPGSTAIICGSGLVWVFARARAFCLAPYLVASWYGVGEALGPLLGAWILYAGFRRLSGSSGAALVTGDRAMHVARVLFGGACVTYGAAHFAYAAYTARMVPAWLPGRTELAYLTGCFHAAAGMGLLLGIAPRLAAKLEATMMCLFGVLVWVPSFFAAHAPDWAPSAQIRWSETLLTFLLASSAWIIAASLRRVSPGPPKTRSGGLAAQGAR